MYKKKNPFFKCSENAADPSFGTRRFVVCFVFLVCLFEIHPVGRFAVHSQDCCCRHTFSAPWQCRSRATPPLPHTSVRSRQPATPPTTRRMLLPSDVKESSLVFGLCSESFRVRMVRENKLNVGCFKREVRSSSSMWLHC